MEHSSAEDINNAQKRSFHGDDNILELVATRLQYINLRS